MSLQHMGFEIEMFTDVELVLFTDPTLLLGHADVVGDVGVDILHYHEWVMRLFPISHSLLVLLLGEEL